MTETVYVLLGEINYRSTDIQGIFKSREGAEKAKEELLEGLPPYDKIHIEERELQP